MVGHLVLVRRPEATENFIEEELAALVTRDTMVGIVPVTVNKEAGK